METIYSIYLIRNLVNKKLYVGFTSKKRPIVRFNQHVADSVRHSYQSVLHAALRKYGRSNFLFEVIYQSKNKEHTLKVMEPYFIERYKPEYNLTKGGDGCSGYNHTNEYIQRMQGDKNPSITMRSNYLVTFKSGQTKVITGFKKFCRDFGYDVPNLNRLKNGKLKSHKDIISIIKL